MARVLIIVEGPSEEAFVDRVLASALWPHRVYVTPIVIGTPGRKGGNVNYARFRNDVISLLKQDQDAYCSTMVDLYGLGDGFPGFPLPQNLSGIEKVTRTESAITQDILAQVPDHRPDLRFIAYLQLHEYEGLLFSEPHAFASAIRQPELAGALRGIRDGFATPEDINDNPAGAPSKRILQLCPSYRKVVDGTIAAISVGIEAMRRECPHFNDWFERLSRLGLA